MGDEENEFKVNRHAVREYLQVLRPKAIQMTLKMTSNDLSEEMKFSIMTHNL